MAFLLRTYAEHSQRAADEDRDRPGPMGTSIDRSAAATKQQPSFPPFEYSSGVGSLCKLLEYLLGVIKEAADPSGADKNGEGAAASAGSSPYPSQRMPGGHRRSLSQQQHVPYQPPLNEVSNDKATLHLLFALKTISRLLAVAGYAVVVRDLLVKYVQPHPLMQLAHFLHHRFIPLLIFLFFLFPPIIRSKEFNRLLTDDLGFSLLQLSGGCSRGSAGAGGGKTAAAAAPAQGSGTGLSTQHGPAVLSAVLGVFGALVQTAGPCMRILVESFVRQVYLKALIQTYDLFLDQVGFFFQI